MFDDRYTDLIVAVVERASADYVRGKTQLLKRMKTLPSIKEQLNNSLITDKNYISALRFFVDDPYGLYGDKLTYKEAILKIDSEYFPNNMSTF